MRRTIVLLATMALTLLVASGVVLAAGIGSAGIPTPLEKTRIDSVPTLRNLRCSWWTGSQKERMRCGRSR